MFKQPILIASNNLDKTAELIKCFKDFKISAESYQNVITRLHFPNEGTTSYLNNARQKATFIFQKLPDESVLGDDSGMIVAAYPDKFGVQTSRQLSNYPSDADKNHYLINLVNGRSRQVTLRTDLILCVADHRVYHGLGVFEGTFNTTERGNNGYGFDKILIPLGETQTLAEMTDTEKTPYLHRTKAIQNLLEKVAQNEYEHF
ncbi:non-canonical purine NTP pyrophosphatase [Pediococcus ethanolidurans]|uniref:non-canonical purine NTP pyrophosphatase n=1 Tax=Pediococcus ethanolidurans TaxID=319653 RepID=UPI0029534701|nr:non-canonical purine NTP pyrophosphatase [Pediococcus ethanolidurans]MDV7718994.1 non-canonical purine NTP pyrophosphatase [Pediococcus ethanolidurans]